MREALNAGRARRSRFHLLRSLHDRSRVRLTGSLYQRTVIALPWSLHQSAGRAIPTLLHQSLSHKRTQPQHRDRQHESRAEGEPGVDEAELPPEVADHRDRGIDMDCRTPEDRLAFVM